LQSLVQTRSVRSQDLVVDATAAARTRLELDRRMTGAQLVEQRVHRERLGVRACGAGRTRSLDVVAVHVPLDVGDVVIAQQCVELAEDVCERVGVGEVEHELVATEHRLVAVGRQRPVGVCPVQVTVGVDHLRLDPDPELHSEAGDVVDQRHQTRRGTRRRHPPVAEPGRVVASGAEPSVVEHEPLDADLGGDVGERHARRSRS
jgi:hypothetical protein